MLFEIVCHFAHSLSFHTLLIGYNIFHAISVPPLHALLMRNVREQSPSVQLLFRTRFHSSLAPSVSSSTVWSGFPCRCDTGAFTSNYSIPEQSTWLQWGPKSLSSPIVSSTDFSLESSLSRLHSTMDFNGLPFDSQFMSRSCTEYTRPSQIDDLSRSTHSLSSRPSLVACPSDHAGLPYSEGQPSQQEFQTTSAQPVEEGWSYSIDGQNVLFMPETLEIDSALGPHDFSQISSFFPLTTKDTTPSYAASATDAAGDGPFYKDRDVVTGLISSEVSNGLKSAPAACASKKLGLCSESGQSCMSSALRILHTLHIPSAACLWSIDEATRSSASRQPRKMDFVLSTNRLTIQQVAELLKCSCVSSTQVQLVLAVICGKLIAWYRAVIRDIPNHDSIHSSSSAAGDVPNERVVHQPFSVGNHLFDTNLECKIRAQVVSSELQQLERVVSELSARIWEEEDVQRNPGTLGTAGRNDQSLSAIDPATVPSRLTSFLHKQLQGAKAVVVRSTGG